MVLMKSQNRVFVHVTPRYPPLYYRYQINRFNLIIRALIGRYTTNAEKQFPIDHYLGATCRGAIENCISTMAFNLSRCLLFFISKSHLEIIIFEKASKMLTQRASRFDSRTSDTDV